MLIATAVVNGDKRFMTSMLMRKANAVAKEAKSANHSQSSFGIAQNSSARPLPSTRNNTANTPAALNSSTLVRLDES